MSYKTIAAMTQSASLINRITAAAAQEHKSQPYTSWVVNNIWTIAASPGWDVAWESAIENDVADPGANEGVITDGMILAAVQPIPGDPDPLP
jgi:hypothetical protein